MGLLIWELRFGLRTLRKSPSFTVVVILTLALGIGATTAIFTLIQQVMLRSLAVARPDQLWRIGDSDRCCFANGYTQGDDVSQNSWNFFSWEAYKHLRANTPAFENLAAFQLGEANAYLAVRRTDPPPRLRRAMASMSPGISLLPLALLPGVAGSSPMPMTRRAHHRLP